jgi:predicted RNA-binding Zn-ribbon protein involved in translation (DUF1610 family)
MPVPLLSLRCRTCGERLELSREELKAKLRELNFLRRDAEPSDELLREIAQSLLASGRLAPCPACNHTTWNEAPPDLNNDDDAAWLGDVRACTQCSATIPRERLEIFPNSKLCAACQKKLDSGAVSNDAEYCPHCGDHLQLRAARSAGATYRMHCPSCRKWF